MLNVKALCAVALSGRCCVPGRRLAGSLQHTSMRKACSEALMSSALSNQIVSCPLPSGRGFLRFPQKPRVEYMFVFVLFFSWKLILQWIFVLLFLHFKSTFLFLFLLLLNMCDLCEENWKLFLLEEQSRAELHIGQGRASADPEFV